ncbi:MAG TPA: hypothetical protein VF572_00545 [Candidatus Saccharimonadales bacterium]|jgi:hypothetical protein
MSLEVYWNYDDANEEALQLPSIPRHDRAMFMDLSGSKPQILHIVNYGRRAGGEIYGFPFEGSTMRETVARSPVEAFDDGNFIAEIDSEGSYQVPIRGFEGRPAHIILQYAAEEPDDISMEDVEWE